MQENFTKQTTENPTQVISLNALDCYTTRFPEIPSLESEEDIETFLKMKADFICHLSENSIFDIGKTLLEVKTKLELNNSNIFEEWLKTINLKKTTAYSYISIYQLLNKKPYAERNKLLKLGVKKLEFLVNKKIPSEVKRQIINDSSLTIEEIEEQINKPKSIENKNDKFAFLLYIDKINFYVKKNKLSKVEETIENLKRVQKIVNLLNQLK